MKKLFLLAIIIINVLIAYGGTKRCVIFNNSDKIVIIENIGNRYHSIVEKNLPDLTVVDSVVLDGSCKLGVQTQLISNNDEYLLYDLKNETVNVFNFKSNEILTINLRNYFKNLDIYSSHLSNDNEHIYLSGGKGTILVNINDGRYKLIHDTFIMVRNTDKLRIFGVAVNKGSVKYPEYQINDFYLYKSDKYIKKSFNDIFNDLTYTQKTYSSYFFWKNFKYKIKSIDGEKVAKLYGNIYLPNNLDGKYLVVIDTEGKETSYKIEQISLK